MNSTIEKILADALSLPLNQRAAVADTLLASLDVPDASIDTVWKKEAEARIIAASEGKMDVVPQEKVFEKYIK